MGFFPKKPSRCDAAKQSCILLPMTREQICASASAKLRQAIPQLKSNPVLIGLDGFVDEIVAVVDKRTGLHDYSPVKTIAALAGKIQNAAGQSSNYELVVKQMKLGGNGPIMANAMASVGLPVTYIGNLGYPNLHPVFESFAEHADVISIAEPGHTDALEFDDGKLMLGKIEPVKDINWDNLRARWRGKITYARFPIDACRHGELDDVAVHVGDLV